MTQRPALLSLGGMKAALDSQLVAELEHVDVNGVRLAYRERGDGTPLVLVHGGISDLTIWDPILDPLARHHRTIAYSRRYAWPNEPIPDGVADTIAQHAADLATLIETLGLGPTDLMGNSWGGFICLVVARDRPELVRKLVVQEPPMVPLFLGAPPSPLALFKTLVTRPKTGRALAGMIFGGMQPTQAALKRGEVQESIEIFARKVALGDAGFDQLPDWVKEHMKLNAGTHISQFRNDGGFVPFSARDARLIQAPVLVMTGEHSPNGLKTLAKELAKLLPNAEEFDVPNASHVMHVANPDAAAKATLGFLEKR